MKISGINGENSSYECQFDTQACGASVEKLLQEDGTCSIRVIFPVYSALIRLADGVYNELYPITAPTHEPCLRLIGTMQTTFRTVKNIEIEECDLPFHFF